MWPDMFHRCARRGAAALSNSGGTGLLRKLNKLFKFSRAPFASSRFGKTQQEHRSHLISALQKGLRQDLVEMFLAPVARDVGRDVADFSVSDLIEHLQKKSGGSNLPSLLCKIC